MLHDQQSGCYGCYDSWLEGSGLAVFQLNTLDFMVFKRDSRNRFKQKEYYNDRFLHSMLQPATSEVFSAPHKQ